MSYHIDFFNNQFGTVVISGIQEIFSFLIISLKKHVKYYMEMFYWTRKGVYCRIFKYFFSIKNKSEWICDANIFSSVFILCLIKNLLVCFIRYIDTFIYPEIFKESFGFLNLIFDRMNRAMSLSR